MEEILKVEGLSKSFGGLVALNNVTFSVKTGEIFGIIGPNGAGKSTMLAVISGFFPPTRGKIIFDGHNITGFKTHDIASLGMSRNFQACTTCYTAPISGKGCSVSPLRAGKKKISCRKPPKYLILWALARLKMSLPKTCLTVTRGSLVCPLPWLPTLN